MIVNAIGAPHLQVNSDDVKASFKDGVLKVTLPKVETSKPKEVPIRVS